MQSKDMLIVIKIKLNELVDKRLQGITNLDKNKLILLI